MPADIPPLPPDTAIQAIYRALNDGAPLIGTRLTVTLTAPPNALPLTAASISWTPRSGQGMSA